MKPKVRIVKAFKHGGSIVITIPSIFAEILEIGEGDFLQVELKDDALVVKKAVLPDLK